MASGGSVFTAAHAGDTASAPDAPDDGLLEFLGSVDTEDENWHDYLARTDIDKVARRAGNGAGTPARVKPATSPASSEPSSDAPPPPPPPPPPSPGKPVTPP